MSTNVIKNTQNSLGKHVKRPPLTEKLLKKPPFRFLHDVITVVIRDTGALNGLYEDREMVSDNVKDRESKIKYLEKAIHCVAFASGETLAVKPGKIVAGQEPDKTNEFLQALARVIEAGTDTSDAVQRVRNGDKPGATNKPNLNNNNNNNSSKPNSRASSVSRKPGGSRDRSRSRDASQAGSSRGSTAKSIDRVSVDDKNESPASLNNDGTGNGGDDSGLGTLAEMPGEDTSKDSLANADPLSMNGHAAEEEPEQQPEVSPPATSAASRPTTTANRARSTRGRSAVKPKPDEDEGFDGGSDQTKTEDAPAPSTTPARPGSAVKSARPRTGRSGLRSARPPSARPAAPRIREKTEVLAEEEMQTRPMTGKVANVIVAGEDDKDDDDGDDFLVEEKPKDTLDLITESQTTQENTNQALETGGQEHGALVQQIIETQKELETAQKPQEKKVEIEREVGGLGDLGRRRDREATQREVDKLRESIQTLTRSANPLGKLMDFLQEDVDAMLRELETWKRENVSLQQELKHEQKLTEQSIEPLKAHLSDLEVAVQEQLDKISTVKSNILKNEEKISRMVSSVGTSTAH